MQRLLFYLLLMTLSACSCGYKASETITIFHAGSLSYPFREVITAFNEEYPNIRVLTESSGSVAGARKITDLNRICDLYATADYKVIEELLYPEHANWYVAFARNEMAIVFNEKSKYSGEINQFNWPEIMLRPDVRFGRSDPDSDPCGYRTLLMWQLAEMFYESPGLYLQLLPKDIRFIRPKEVDLLALLETNTVDYIFLYRSVAEQHGLSFMILPDSVNLGNPLLDSYYDLAKVDVRGNSPGETFTFSGEPMVYAITIPLKAPNHATAATFLKFLLDTGKGLRIMEENGQPALNPPFCDFPENAPEAILEFIK